MARASDGCYKKHVCRHKPEASYDVKATQSSKAYVRIESKGKAKENMSVVCMCVMIQQHNAQEDMNTCQCMMKDVSKEERKRRKRRGEDHRQGIGHRKT